MKLAIMQPYFFPYLGYYQLLHAANGFVFLDNVNYINKGWINRNNILINGKASLFTIPLSNASQNELIQNVQIFNAEIWRGNFFKTLEMNYKKAPFFSSACDLIRVCMSNDQTSISDWAMNSIVQVTKYLDLNVDFFKASQLNNLHGKGEERIISINENFGATQYINPIGGKELYDASNFSKKGIELFFIEMNQISYSQGKNVFVPNLSMIDVLMWNDPDNIRSMLSKYKLVHG
jgi:hypothetical protein